MIKLWPLRTKVLKFQLRRVRCPLPKVTLKKASKQRSRDPFYIFCGATCLRIRGEEVRLRRYHPTLTEVSLTRWARFLYGDRDCHQPRRRFSLCLSSLKSGGLTTTITPLLSAALATCFQATGGDQSDRRSFRGSDRYSLTALPSVRLLTGCRKSCRSRQCHPN